MWEIRLTYTDDETGKDYNRVRQLSNMEFSRLKSSGRLENEIACEADITLQEFLWLNRQQTEQALLASNCASSEQLVAATKHWWNTYQHYKEASKYSASCISDSEHMRDALYRWQECTERVMRILAGVENF